MDPATTADPVGVDMESCARNFIDTLTSEERELVEASKVAKVLLSEVADADALHAKTSGLRSWSERMLPFVAGIEQYAKCIDVFAQTSDLLCPIWGGFRIVLHLAKEFGEYFGKIASMLESIGQVLSNIPRYAQLYPDNTRLRDCTAGIYRAILEFCLKARHIFRVGRSRSCSMKTFKGAVALSAALRLSWKPFDAQFGEVKGRIEKLVEAVVAETDIAERELTRVEGARNDARWEAVGATNKRLNLALDNENVKKVNNWLSPVNVAASHKTVTSLRYADTGSWFLAGESFRTWMAEDNAFLWLHAIPGAGKTVLVSTIINYLHEKVQSPEVGLAYFYCDYKESQKQEPSRILATIVAELTKQSRAAFEEVEAFVQAQYQDLSTVTADFDLLLHNFQSLVAEHFDKVIIVVDGLDEVAPADWTCMTHALITLRQTCRNVKVVVSSRNELPIARAFEGLPSHQITETDVAADIKAYVGGEVASSIKRKKLKLRDPALEGIIIDTLCKGANGMFQWATCQIDALCRMRNDKAIRAALTNLPRTLQATYLRILERTEQDFPDDVQVVRRILCWLVRGTRRLTLAELAEAISIEVDGDETSMDFDAVDNDPQDVLEVLGGIVTVTADGYISLAHLSVKDYLVSEDLKKNKPVFWIGRPDIEANLAAVCLKYLCYDDFGETSATADDDDEGEEKITEKRLETYAFLRYAAQSWAHHAACSEQPEALESESDREQHERVVELTMQFFRSEGNFACWAATCRHCRFHAKLTRQEAVPLHCAASFGLVAATKSLLEDEEDGCCEVAEPFRSATVAGHDGVVKLLLEYWSSHCGAVKKDAGAESKDENDKTKASGVNLNEALYLAAARGHDNVVRTLIDHGALVNAVAGKEGTAIQVAALEGRYDTVKLLLDKGAHHNVRSKRYGTPLAAAAEKGHGRTAAVLIAGGADPNGRGGWYSLPLVSAIAGKNVELVRSLVAHGADVDARGGRLGCAVMAAASYGMADLLEELVVQKGAKVNDEDDKTSDALYSASLAGHVECVKLLLRLGADVNAMGGKHRNALGAASWEGHAGIVGELLAAGADREFFDAEKGNAVHLAASKGYLDIVKMLVEAGIDPLACISGKGGAMAAAASAGHQAVVEYIWSLGKVGDEALVEHVYALTAAALNNRVSIVRFLLDQNVGPGQYMPNPGQQTPECGRPMDCAAARGHMEVLEMLLSEGDDSYAYVTEEWFGTPLIAAIASEQRPPIEVVRRLLDAGADANVAATETNHCYGLPLMHAVRRGDAAIVELLLDRGAEVDGLYETTPTALQEAVAKGEDDMTLFELLISRGANVNLETGAKDLWNKIEEKNGLAEGPITALQTAVWHGYGALVERLLDLGAKTSVDDDDAPFKSALQIAAFRGNLELVRKLLDRGADVNEKGGHLGTALQAAAGQCHEQVLRALIEAGADVTEQSVGWFRTPLVAVIVATGATLTPKARRLMDMLLEHGLDVNAKITTPLAHALVHAVSEATEAEEFPVIDYLLDKGADVNARGGRLGTALQAAASNGCSDLASHLIERGADPNITGGTFHTPLQAAYKHGWFIVINVLINAGARLDLFGGVGGGPLGLGLGYTARGQLIDGDNDPHGSDWGCCPTLVWQHVTRLGFDVNLEYGHWGNALQNVIMSNREDSTFYYVLDAGADVNRVAGFMGTALAAAAWQGNAEYLDELLKRGADVNLGNERYPNAAFAAIIGQERDALKTLLEKGANVVSARSKIWGDALQLAVMGSGKSLSMPRTLLRAGAPVDPPSTETGTGTARNGSGKWASALGAAAIHGNKQALGFLLRKGADVHIQGGRFGSVLQAAALGSTEAMVELLLKKGADVNHRGGRYGSALQAAAASGRSMILLLLLRHGADVNMKGAKYGTALQAACSNGSVSSVKILVEHGADVNLEGGIFKTPIRAAAVGGWRLVVEYLLQQGAVWEDIPDTMRHISATKRDAANALVKEIKEELDKPATAADDETASGGEETKEKASDTEAEEEEKDFLPLNVEAIPGHRSPLVKSSTWETVRGLSVHILRQKVLRVESMELDKSKDLLVRPKVASSNSAVSINTAVASLKNAGRHGASPTTGSIITVTRLDADDYGMSTWEELTTLEVGDI